MRKCSKCGTKMIADTSHVLTSYPPQYMFRCPNCGNVEYGLCTEAEEEEAKEVKKVEDTTNWDSIRNWAAMFAMSGIIANGKFLMTERNVSEIAVSYADKLIEELKKQ